MQASSLVMGGIHSFKGARAQTLDHCQEVKREYTGPTKQQRVEKRQATMGGSETVGRETVVCAHAYV